MRSPSLVFEANILVSLRAESGNSDMPMMWIFPYFFEPRILECLPSFTMLDYQVYWQYITSCCLIQTYG